MPELVCSADDPRWQDDTRSRPRSAGRNSRAGLDQAVIDQRGTLVPRAAGAAPTRGAQPPASGPMSDLSARVSPAELEAQLEALGDWRALLDEELAEMAETTRRIGRMIRRG